MALADYQNADIPYTEPARPMRTFSELAAVDYAKDVFFDENGLPNDYYWRLVDDVSIFNYPQPDVNGANADVMAAAGQYTDAQQQHLKDYLDGTGQNAQQGQQWFLNTATVSAVAGVGGNSTQFGTTISALRVTITVHEGHSQYRLSAVVAPQGGATTNQRCERDQCNRGGQQRVYNRIDVPKANAGIGDWKNYTDMSNVVGIVCAPNAVWVGTSGGILRFNPADSTFQRFTNSEGLTGNDVSAIGLDKYGSVWVGETSGEIDIYTPATNSWKNISDIALSTQTQKMINSFTAYGDTI